MPKVLDWSDTADAEGIARQVRDALATARVALVQTATDVLLLLNATAHTAKEILTTLRSLERSCSLLVIGAQDATQLGIPVPPLGARLMQRGWPGPLTLALPAPHGLAIPTAWKAALEEKVVRNGEVLLRSPEHPLFDRLLPSLEFPVLSVDVPPEHLDAALEALGDAAALLIRDTDEHAMARPTTVRVTVSGWSVLSEGAVSKVVVGYLTARMILFVCTGNTCRSPMASALAKRMLADRLGCGVDELPMRGYWIMSAGVSVYGSDPATPAAAEVVAELGADLSSHQSQPVNPQLLVDADDVIAMTHGHAAALAIRYPGLGPRVRLLCGDDDLLDPIGGDSTVYRECARTIQLHLERLVTEWMAS